METLQVKRSFELGPLDGHTELVNRPGIDYDVAWTDESGRGYHYRLSSLPEGDSPIQLCYRFLSEFDPNSDYVDRVAETVFAEVLEPSPTDVEEGEKGEGP